MFVVSPIQRADRTGSEEYDVAKVTFLTPADQEALPYRIAAQLPWNHFGRKNIGYLYAIHHGAKVRDEAGHPLCKVVFRRNTSTKC